MSVDSYSQQLCRLGCRCARLVIDLSISKRLGLPQRASVSTALIVRAFPTCLQAGYWPSRRFRSFGCVFVSPLQASCDFAPFCMWLPQFTIAHRVDPHGLSRFDSILLAKSLSDPPFACFCRACCVPFLLCPIFLLSASLLGVLSGW
jgi:hypothetical protein